LGRWYKEKPLNFAHRGASGHAPANTMAAFLLAAEMGADGIELDVHLSADVELVVIHDHAVDSTTDGQGPVSALSLAELQQLDAGSWFAPRFAGERIPTLRQVLEAVGQRLLINVEIKVAPGHHPPTLEREVVRLIEEGRMVDRVLISSFSPRSLRRVRRLNRRIPLGLLYSRPAPAVLPALLRWLRLSYDALHPHYGLVDARAIARARERGQRVNVWTVNDAREMRRMCDLGVDGIITNYPDVLNHVLAGT
jgi:glycerophosphoryl diester phosphodiesterase